MLHVTYVGPGAFRGPQISIVGESNKLITCIGEALATRPIEERGQYHYLFGENNDDQSRRRLNEDSVDSVDDEYFSSIKNTSVYYYDDDDDTNNLWYKLQANQPRHAIEKQWKKNDVPSPTIPLLGKDEILQIKILYGGKSCTDNCSRVRKVMYPLDREKTRLFRHRHEFGRKNETRAEMVNGTTRFLRGQAEMTRHTSVSNGTASASPSASNSTSATNSDTAPDEIDEFSTPEYWEDPTYRFAIDDALLYLDVKSIYLHNISVVNVTLTERCLSTGADDGK